jgi:homeobox-leucine zipper protein
MQSAEPAADLPEKGTKRSKLLSQVECPQEGGEGEEKAEAGKEGVGKGAKETSSESISSELLNEDSPRTSMDSGGGGALLPLESIGAEMGDLLGDQLLSLHGCHRISIKLEDGSFQDESSCNYMLAQLDEERGLPWWDWA